MTTSQAMRTAVAKASGWVLLFSVLSQLLSIQEVSVVFGTLLVAELISTLLCDMAWNTVRAPASFISALNRLLVGWMVICGLVLLLLRTELSLFYRSDSYAAFCLLGLILIFGLLDSGLRLQTRRPMIWAVFTRFRIFCFSIPLALISTVDGLTAATALSGIVLFNLFLLLPMLFGLLMQDPIPELFQRAEASGLTTRIMRDADVLILLWLLPTSQALPYLLAKGMAQLSPTILHHIGSSAEAKLERALLGESNGDFIAMAARLNLGAVLIGGGLSLATAVAGPYLLPLLELELPEAQTVLLWLVLGTTAPVFFGFTDLLLKIVGMAWQLRVLDILAATAFALMMFSSHTADMVYLAQVYAAVALSRSAVAAAILALRAGVWPGLTALVLRQIKLF